MSDPNAPHHPTDPGLTRAEVFPFSSNQLSLLRSRAFLPILLAIGAFFYFTTAPFHTERQVYAFIDCLGVFIALTIFLEIYNLSGIDRSVYAYLPAALLVVAQLLLVPAPWFFVFHRLLGGEPDTLVDSDSVLTIFRVYFTGAGLMEELIKALPVLLGFCIARAALGYPRVARSRLARLLMLRGPLDGLLTGLAGAIGFLLVETLGQYVPKTITDQLSGGNDFASAVLFGIHTLIPRTVNLVLGHGAWAGITGYFIGLAVRHPDAALKLIPASVLIAAALHGAWDTSTSTGSMPGMVVVGLLSAALFLACLVKAQQLNAVDYGIPGGPPTLAVAPPATTAPPPVDKTPGAPRPAAAFLTRALGALERMAGVHARAARPATPIAIGGGRVGADPPAAFILRHGQQDFPLTPGASLDLSILFAAIGVPPGHAAVVERHPTHPHDLGLRNSGTASWTARGSSGEARPIDPGRTLEIEAGTRLTLGTATVTIETA